MSALEHDHAPAAWHAARESVRRGDVEYYIRCSGGNDSIALIEHMRERGLLDRSMILSSDTGWGSAEWPARVRSVFDWALGLGAVAALVVDSIGMEALIEERKIWPNRIASFCTKELKIRPTLEALAYLDPLRELTGVIGVRREESGNRASHPEWLDGVDDDRDVWAPLVRVTATERDELIARAGWEVLPHRSMDCEACHHRDRAGMRLISQPMLHRIRVGEAKLAKYGPGRFLYKRRPIDEAMEWAHSEPRRHVEGQTSMCTSGWCDT